MFQAKILWHQRSDSAIYTFAQWPIYPRFIPLSDAFRLPGLLRKDKHPRRHIFLLLRLLWRKGHQQRVDPESKSADHEDQSQQRIRLLEHEIGDRV